MPKMLEFEKKYILDDKRQDEILKIVHGYGATEEYLRQFYMSNIASEWDRYRFNGTVALLEKKVGINIGVDYSINREGSMEVPMSTFESGWKTAKRRLRKVRYTVPAGSFPTEEDMSPVHTLVLDIFLTDHDPLAERGIDRFANYAIMAEVECILDDTHRVVDTNFQLPRSLQPFCLLAVDSRDSSSKAFSSLNLFDEATNVEKVRQTIERLR